MNHFEMPHIEFQFTDNSGKNWILNGENKVKLPETLILSAHFASTVHKDEDGVEAAKDVFRIKPVSPFTPDILKGTHNPKLRSPLFLQDFIALVNCFGIKSLVVENLSTGETQKPNHVCFMQDERINFEVKEAEGEQDFDRIMVILNNADTDELVKQRAENDDCRNMDEDGCLDDWLEFFGDESVYTFKEFKVDGEELTLCINEKDKI